MSIDDPICWPISIIRRDKNISPIEFYNKWLEPLATIANFELVYEANISESCFGTVRSLATETFIYYLIKNIMPASSCPKKFSTKKTH